MKDVISTLSEKLRKKEISSVELTTLYIEAIEKENSILNAYVTKTPDVALKQAERADQMISEGKAGILTGIPMTLKDNICTDGLLTTCCSKILDGFKPYYNATVWENLLKEGAVLLGKTNMDEFAMGSTSESSCYGAPKNPLDHGHVTGGSSGGVAAAVAGNIAAYGLGSDTGGSIRQPASYCGIVGLKPTYGAVSRYGLIAYGSSLDQIGPLTTSVKDAAFVFEAIQSLDKKDHTSGIKHGKSIYTGNYKNLSDHLDKEIKGMKIGIAKEFFEGIDPLMEKQIMKAVETFKSMGAEIIEIDLPALKLALPVYYIIACAEASSNLGRFDGIRYGHRTENYANVEEMILKTRTEGFGDEVKRRIMLGTYVLSSGYYDAYYKKACIIRDEIRKEMLETFEICDLLLAPTAPSTAPVLGKKSENPVEMYLSDICTVPINIAGVPAISLPCGMDTAGLPVGIQLIGKWYDEATILQAAYAFEKTSDQVVTSYKGGVQL